MATWSGSAGVATIVGAPSHPYGSSLLGVTQVGAFHLLELTSESEPMHWDVWLRNTLISKLQTPAESADEAAGCFVWPSVGGYDSHMSGCEPSIGVRYDPWKVGGSQQEGVRPFLKSHFSRWLCGWDERGRADWLKIMHLKQDEESFAWKTMRPPLRRWQNDDVWKEMLELRGWVDGNEFVGPRDLFDTSKGTPGKGSRWRELEQLAKHPDEHEPVQGSPGEFSPITRLAEQLVTDPVDFPWSDTGHPAKVWGTRRKFMLGYKRRHFVDQWDEAGRPRVLCGCSRLIFFSLRSSASVPV